MPKAGLTPEGVVAAGAELADEIGYHELTLAKVAERVGVRAPSLYKHIDSQADLNRRIAVLALNQAGAAIGTAIQGCAGRDALAAAAYGLRDFVLRHPGRYAATLSNPHVPGDTEDPVAVAAARGLDPFRAVLRGYNIAEKDEIHALRALRSIFHAVSSLQALNGFQYDVDIDDSFEWLISLVDQGLRNMRAINTAFPS